LRISIAYELHGKDAVPPEKVYEIPIQIIIHPSRSTTSPSASQMVQLPKQLKNLL